MKELPIHHLEDLITGSKDKPELRELARQMVDKVRDLRRDIDELRINELARKKIKEIVR